jgi:pimeloyl-ACP methyl ester carboxylesterase
MRTLGDHFRLDRFFLVATSCNEPAAFQVAADQPESVLRLVLAGGTPAADS